MSQQDETVFPPVSGAPPRRRFWRDLLGEVLNLQDAAKGVRRQSLRDITGVPDAVLREMVPLWMDGLALDVREDGIYRQSQDGKAVCIHVFAEHDRAIVDQFHCGRNLETIAACLAGSAGLGRATAYNAVKALFIRFCQCGWCHPAASHVRHEGDRS
jgi:hypothetical protein